MNVPFPERLSQIENSLAIDETMLESYGRIKGSTFKIILFVAACLLLLTMSVLAFIGALMIDSNMFSVQLEESATMDVGVDRAAEAQTVLTMLRGLMILFGVVVMAFAMLQLTGVRALNRLGKLSEHLKREIAHKQVQRDDLLSEMVNQSNK